MVQHKANYKYLDWITVAFSIVIILSNLIGAVKIVKITVPFIDFSFSCSAGLFLFPVSYLIGDILTEVYGYSKSRRVIWTGFAALITANAVVQFFNALPAHPDWGLQEAFSAIFKQSLRLSAASMIAYFCGEFTNSYVIAKLKVLNKGKSQALRIIGSTMAGELVDTVLVLFLGFYGAVGYPLDLIYKIMITNYVFKVSWEIIVYPIFTMHFLKFLKKSENEDYYDYETDFNPFHIGAQKK